MRRIYLRAGLFAEGPTDYAFLGRLLPRLLESITAAEFPGACDIEETICSLDAPGLQASRAECICSAFVANADLFEILVIHSDGGGNPRASRQHCVEPGLAAIRASYPDIPLFAAACIPVREIEAWMLTDPAALQAVLGRKAAPKLPAAPERIDPKVVLTQILKDGDARRGSVYEIVGAQVHLSTLRSLPAFQVFESELTQAVRSFVATQRGRA